VIDIVHSVLGEYETSHAQVQIQRPQQTIVNKEGDSQRKQTSDVPDLVSIHGTLQTSPRIEKNATLIVNFRRGSPFPGTAPFVWTINCEKGEIRMSSPIGPSLHAEAAEHVFPIEIHDFAANEVKPVEWQWEDWRAALPPRSRNIAKLYDLFAEGRFKEFPCVDFEAAVVRHKQLDKMLYEKDSS
jgi:predicted dehydrogenase